MEKKLSGIKKFFAEFKKFITRGNVLDMSVGVIVGGAFTGIVNGLSNYILKPLINWLLAELLGEQGLSGAITMLSPGYITDATTGVKTLDLASSIYIDWGSFISAIINFLLIAFVLFTIVKMINSFAEMQEKMLEQSLSKGKAIAKIRVEQKVSKKQALIIWEEQLKQAQAKKAEEERIKAENEAKAKAEAEEKAMANTRLLEEIRDLLKNK